MATLRVRVRPACPFCGAPDPNKFASNRWICRRCGTQWGRSPGEFEALPKREDLEVRPPCPDCGYDRPLRNGKDDFLCRHCGRYYRDNQRSANWGYSKVKEEDE